MAAETKKRIESLLTAEGNDSLRESSLLVVPAELPTPPRKSKAPDFKKIVIWPMTCARALVEANKKGLYPLAWMFGSPVEPGAGWETGDVPSQEQELFLCTSVSAAMTGDKYPLGRTGGLLVPRARVIRNKKGGLLPEEKQFDCSIVNVPAIRQPGQLSAESESLTQRIIWTVFNAGGSSGARCLISGAAGCGFYGNPVADIARLQIESILQYEWTERYEHIVFAVPDEKHRQVFAAALAAAELSVQKVAEAEASPIARSSTPPPLPAPSRSSTPPPSEISELYDRMALTPGLEAPSAEISDALCTRILAASPDSLGAKILASIPDAKDRKAFVVALEAAALKGVERQKAADASAIVRSSTPSPPSLALLSDSDLQDQEVESAASGDQ